MTDQTKHGPPDDLDGREKPFSAEELLEIGRDISRGLPSWASETVVRLLDVDPWKVHAFWSLTQRDAVRAGIGKEGYTLVLRFVDMTPSTQGAPAHPSFDIAVEGLVNNWYVDLWKDGKSYVADLGVRGPDGGFVVLARSNQVDLPPGGPSQSLVYRQRETQTQEPSPETLPREGNPSEFGLFRSLFPRRDGTETFPKVSVAGMAAVSQDSPVNDLPADAETDSAELEDLALAALIATSEPAEVVPFSPLEISTGSVAVATAAPVADSSLPDASLLSVVSEREVQAEDVQAKDVQTESESELFPTVTTDEISRFATIAVAAEGEAVRALPSLPKGEAVDTRGGESAASAETPPAPSVVVTVGEAVPRLGAAETEKGAPPRPPLSAHGVEAAKEDAGLAVDAPTQTQDAAVVTPIDSAAFPSVTAGEREPHVTTFGTSEGTALRALPSPPESGLPDEARLAVLAEPPFQPHGQTSEPTAESFEPGVFPAVTADEVVRFSDAVSIVEEAALRVLPSLPETATAEKRGEQPAAVTAPAQRQDGVSSPPSESVAFPAVAKNEIARFSGDASSAEDAALSTLSTPADASKTDEPAKPAEQPPESSSRPNANGGGANGGGAVAALPLESIAALSSFVNGPNIEFEINAELIIYGRARPGSALSLYGRPVALADDGTFSVRRPLPQGALVLPLLLSAGSNASKGGDEG